MRTAARWLPVAVALAFVLGGLLLQASRPMGHDLAWLVHASGRMLDGADVYGRDLFEWNPPANLRLLAPGVWLGRIAGGAEITATRLWLGTLLGLSLLLTNAVAARLLPREDDGARRWLMALLAFVLFVQVEESFGQREHVILALLLPQVMVVAAVWSGRETGRPLAVASGVAAGVATSLKPQYLIVIAAFELALLARTRRASVLRRPDLLALGAVLALEAAAIALLTPGYATTVVPLARDSYWVYQASWRNVLEARDLVLMALAPLPWLLLRGRPSLQRLGAVLLVAAGAFLAVALLQRTGWDYHLVPFHGALTALFALPLLRLLPDSAGPAGAPVGGRLPGLVAAAGAGTAVLAALLLLPSRHAEVWRAGAVWRRGGTDGFVALLEQTMRRHAEGGTVYAISPSLVNVFPAVLHADVRWGSRFAGFYLPAVVVRQRRGDAEVPARLDAARADEIEAFLRDAVVDDLRRQPPDLILVDTVRRRKVFAGVPFDFVAWLGEDPRFAEIWSRYEVVGRAGRFEVAVPR